MILNHLWQSSLFVVAVWVLTLALRTNRAAVRYRLWLAASVKFLIPFSLLVSLGGQFGWRTAAPVVNQAQVSFVMEEIGRASVAPVAVASAAPGFNFVPILMGIWVVGILVGVVLWMRSWWRIRAVLLAASAREYRFLRSRLGRTGGQVGNLPHLPILISSTRMEPGVFGIFRPVLLLPEGITERLTPAQLEAIVAHELCHVRRRDNLTGAIHMVVETIFWFHPLVWWIRARLIDERERACDEEVLRMGSAAEVYAESILEACKLYLESPLACVSGVTGSDLKKRIEAIMANRRVARVNFSKKVMLAAAAMAAVMGPVAVGVLNAPRGMAQSQRASRLKFEVASVKPDSPGGLSTGDVRILPGGRLSARQAVLRFFIQNAYGLRPFQIIGAPDWVNSEGYSIEAKAQGNPSPDQMREMMQSLLEDRFKMRAHRETRELPVYALTAAKGGLKLPEPKEGGCIASDPDGPPLPPGPGTAGPCGRVMVRISGVAGARIQGGKISMAELTRVLSNMLGRTVIDKTGFAGMFDVRLEFAMDDAVDGLPHPPGSTPDLTSVPSVFVAVQEQLGLKLESTKGPVDVLVIDHVERPSGNEQAFFKRVLWTPQAAPKAFEVASVKINKSGAMESEVQMLPGGRVTVRNVPLKALIGLAYHVRPNMISGAPGWLDEDRYDVIAKAFPKASEDDLRVMIQALLVERFKMEAHREEKQVPGYAMIVGKTGAKLGKAETKRPDEPGCVPQAGSTPGQHHVVCHMGMEQFAEALPMLAKGYLDRPVVDQTGIEGFYKLRLDWTGAAQIDVFGGRTVFEAVELLGLKLESRKVTLPAIVVDHVERTPTEN